MPESQICLAEKILTDAQIKALPTTPVEIVAAPGVGHAILPITSFWIIDASEGAYTNISTDGAYLTLAYTGGVELCAYIANDSSLSVQDFENFFFSATKQIWTLTQGQGFLAFWGPGTGTGFSQAAGNNATGVENKALNIRGASGGGNLTGGNAANTLKVALLYTIIDTIIDV